MLPRNRIEPLIAGRRQRNLSSSFGGGGIAKVRQTDDVEDKLIVVPIGTRLTDGEIARATAFQEQSFQPEILRG